MLFSYEELRVLGLAINYLFENQEAIEEARDWEIDWELVDQVRGAITRIMIEAEAVAIRQSYQEAEYRRSRDQDVP